MHPLRREPGPRSILQGHHLFLRGRYRILPGCFRILQPSLRSLRRPAAKPILFFSYVFPFLSILIFFHAYASFHNNAPFSGCIICSFGAKALWRHYNHAVLVCQYLLRKRFNLHSFIYLFCTFSTRSLPLKKTVELSLLRGIIDMETRFRCTFTKI